MSSTGQIRRNNDHVQHVQHIHYPFWFGGSASCFAASVTHPLDLSESLLPVECFCRSANISGSQGISKYRPTFLIPPLLLTYLKVRLQTRVSDGPKGMLATFVHVLKNDGFLGLYSGVRCGSSIFHLLPKFTKPPCL